MLTSCYVLGEIFSVKNKVMDVKELEFASQKNLPVGSSVNQVTRFLDKNHLSYRKDYHTGNKTPDLIYGDYVVQHSWVWLDRNEVQFIFCFDDGGKLTDSSVDYNTNGL